jgi:hypothetical protein
MSGESEIGTLTPLSLVLSLSKDELRGLHMVGEVS